MYINLKVPFLNFLLFALLTCVKKLVAKPIHYAPAVVPILRPCSFDYTTNTDRIKCTSFAVVPDRYQRNNEANERRFAWTQHTFDVAEDHSEQKAHSRHKTIQRAVTPTHFNVYSNGMRAVTFLKQDTFQKVPKSHYGEYSPTSSQKYHFLYVAHSNNETAIPTAAPIYKREQALPKQFSKRYKPGHVNYRLQKELKEFLANPPMNCTVSVHPNNLRIWIVTLQGIEGTVYAGEIYKLKVTFPASYPFTPPTVYFLSPAPRHPHVYSNGDICLNLLGSDWKPSLRASTIILAIISMLSSAKEKRLPIDNASLAGTTPGGSQTNFMYHDEKC